MLISFFQCAFSPCGRRTPKLDLDVSPYLPRATVDKTSPASYLCLMGGDAR